MDFVLPPGKEDLWMGITYEMRSFCKSTFFSESFVARHDLGVNSNFSVPSL